MVYFLLCNLKKWKYLAGRLLYFSAFFNLKQDFSGLYSHTGTPSNPIRLLVGLLLLIKQLYILVFDLFHPLCTFQQEKSLFTVLNAKTFSNFVVFNSHYLNDLDKKTVEMIIIHSKNKEQASLFEQMAKALNVPFEKGQKENSYDPEFVKELLRAKKDIEEGKGIKIKTADLWK